MHVQDLLREKNNLLKKKTCIMHGVCIYITCEDIEGRIHLNKTKNILDFTFCDNTALNKKERH